MKRVDIMYIIIMVIAVVLLASCFLAEDIFDAIDDYGEEVSSDYDDAKDDGEVDDVEGWGLVFEGSLLGLGAFAGLLILGVAFFVGIYAVLLIIIASLARALFKPQGFRLGLYRVLMTMVYIAVTLLVATFVSILLEGFNVVLFICALALTVVIVYCMVNTYSKRIIQ